MAESGGKKASGFGKVISSMKSMVGGSESGRSPQKDGATISAHFKVPVNRAEVVLPMRRPKSIPDSEVESIVSIPASSQMPPPSSASGSMVSFRSSSKRERERDLEFENMILRQELNASQEEVAFTKRRLVDFKASTEKYIRFLRGDRDDGGEGAGSSSMSFMRRD